MRRVAVADQLLQFGFQFDAVRLARSRYDEGFQDLAAYLVRAADARDIGDRGMVIRTLSTSNGPMW